MDEYGERSAFFTTNNNDGTMLGLGETAVSLALVGNFAPRKCGIATFTTDLYEKLSRYHPAIATTVYALDDAAGSLAYPDHVHPFADGDVDAYRETARAINRSGAQAVWLQHEYGIFGGDRGDMVFELVERLAAPLIVTFHTVLSEPDPKQRAILERLVARASRMMVMSQHSRDLLCRIYHAPSELVEVIEHGAPDCPFGRTAKFKETLGLSDGPVLTSFGLLGPGKGLETLIEALPAILERHPSCRYRILGETHPNLLARDGEAYRERLVELADALDVAHAIDWENRFLDTDDLLDQLEACDIYLTPYPNLQQSTSGTLSYAVALGKAVISTPYVHARELLADGIGSIVPPGDAQAIAGAVNALLDDPDALARMQRRAYDRGRTTIWPRFADASAQLVRSAVAHGKPPAGLFTPPSLDAVFAMSDRTGMLQHAVGPVPDRGHGYCLDDNARCLMLLGVAQTPSERERRALAFACSSFVQHAWNAEETAFRNFMSYDRSWSEERGSDDANGRAVWALGHVAAFGQDADLREWAKPWYDRALRAMAGIDSPRACAFSTLGAAAMLRARPGHDISIEHIERSGALLASLLAASRRPDWAWFEAVLGYDNPRLPQALIEAGAALGNREWVQSGLDSLEWIAGHQRAANGHFRPIGSDTFGKTEEHLPFDQQPLEAQAAIEAALTAYRVSGDARWIDHADAAWAWFFGENDRGVVLADMASGRCHDGINPRGINANCGAESILAFQLGYYAMVELRNAQPGRMRGQSLGSRPDLSPEHASEDFGDPSPRRPVPRRAEAIPSRMAGREG